MTFRVISRAAPSRGGEPCFPRDGAPGERGARRTREITRNEFILLVKKESGGRFTRKVWVSMPVR